MPDTQNSEAELKAGDEIELEITNIAHGGVCVARHNGRVVFVADAIPGERVMARVTETRKKSFARAATIHVIEASPHRREHVWPEASIERDPDDRAGGAEFGHIALHHQRALKKFVIEDALKRFASIERDVMVHAAPGDDQQNGLGWRTRVKLHVNEDGVVGPYAARSNRVIPVSALPLAADEINNIAPLTELMPNVDEIDLVAPSGSALNLSEPRMLLRYRGSRDRIGVHDSIHEQVGNRTFQVSAGGFWQVHREAAGVLSRAVSQIISRAIETDEFEADAPNLDLYGGVGLLAAAMGDAAGSSKFKVTSVESDSRATDFAAENLADWVGARSLTARVDLYLRDLVNEARGSEHTAERIRRATYVIDPPRSGAGGEVCNSLIELSPQRIIYVACDPVALARDLATLTQGGYQLESLEGHDLFPHTHHVEAVASLRRV